MIRTRYFQIDGTLQPDLDPGAFPAALSEEGSLLWVDFIGEAPEVCEPILLKTFNPTLMNVTLSANSAYHGGGMKNEASNPILRSVAFSANSAAYSGGGMQNEGGSPTLTNTTFYSNSAVEFGGGMQNNGSSPILTNVIFTSNSANRGGGISNSIGGPTLTNVTFFENQAGYGGAIYNSYSSNPVLTNTILWNDTGNEIYDGTNTEPSTLIVTYSDVQGGWPGTGNIDADPMFVDAVNGDLHLQSGSPAIDTGRNGYCPPTDYDGAPRFQDGNNDGIFKCDMGAFEFPGAIPPSLPPIADAGGPYTANEGETFTLDASNSYDPEGGAIVRSFVRVGFTIIATEGASAFLKRRGINNRPVLKASEGTLNIIDIIRNGWVQLIINTPLGQLSRKDEHAIGRTAYEYKIPFITTLSAAASAAKSIEQLRTRRLGVLSIQEHHELASQGGGTHTVETLADCTRLLELHQGVPDVRCPPGPSISWAFRATITMPPRPL